MTIAAWKEKFLRTGRRACPKVASRPLRQGDTQPQSKRDVKPRGGPQQSSAVAVDTIVWSSAARNIPSISAEMINSTRRWLNTGTSASRLESVRVSVIVPHSSSGHARRMISGDRDHWVQARPTEERTRKRRQVRLRGNRLPRLSAEKASRIRRSYSSAGQQHEQLRARSLRSARGMDLTTDRFRGGTRSSPDDAAFDLRDVRNVGAEQIGVLADDAESTEPRLCPSPRSSSSSAIVAA